jgi:hypothetical protein
VTYLPDQAGWMAWRAGGVGGGVGVWGHLHLLLQGGGPSVAAAPKQVHAFQGFRLPWRPCGTDSCSQQRARPPSPPRSTQQRLARARTRRGGATAAGRQSWAAAPHQKRRPLDRLVPGRGVSGAQGRARLPWRPARTTGSSPTWTFWASRGACASTKQTFAPKSNGPSALRLISSGGAKTGGGLHTISPRLPPPPKREATASTWRSGATHGRRFALQPTVSQCACLLQRRQ